LRQLAAVPAAPQGAAHPPITPRLRPLPHRPLTVRRSREPGCHPEQQPAARSLDANAASNSSCGFAPAAFAEAAAPTAASPKPGRADPRPTVAPLAFAATELLLISELVDRLEHLEDNVVIGWLNLTFATMVATVIVCALALIGDSALDSAERRIGHRPGSRSLTPLLATGGCAALCGILAAHLSHPLALDGWIGLAGALLLLVAAVHRHAAA
jgi:hypothetical protein